MNQNQVFHLNSNNQYYLFNEDYPSVIFNFICNEIKNYVNGQNVGLYFLDSSNKLKSNQTFFNKELTDKIAFSVYTEKTNSLIKKDSYLNFDKDYSTKNSYISCLIGDKNESFGVFILEGIEKYDNFSQLDFNLVSEFCANLSNIFKNLSTQIDNQFYVRFATSISLLLYATNQHQKSASLGTLLEEVIRVTGLINSNHQLTALLLDVMESVKDVFKTESCSILLLDRRKNELYFHIIAGEKEEEISKIRVPMGKGIAGTVAQTKVPMVINDAQNDSRVYKVVDKESGFVTRNILAAPLVVNDEVIGVMEAINTIDRNNFNDSDINLFLSFSDAAAAAIQKARLLDNLVKTNKELQKKVSELGSLFELGQAVLESKDVNDLNLKSLKIIVRELDANRAVLITEEKKKTKDRNKNKVVEESLITALSIINGKEEVRKINFQMNSVIIHAIIQNKIELKKLNDIRINEFDEFDENFLVGSYIILPLVNTDKKPFGAICISDKSGGDDFNTGHLQLLQTISAQFIKGFENINLNKNLINQKTVEKEIEITKNIQKNILPSKPPSGSNFDFGVKTVAAKDVSGDFYDYYKYEDGQFSFLIADVSGKSLPAAIFMAMSSSVMRTLSRNHALKPEELLTQANKLIHEDSQSGMFVTLFFIHYNPSIPMIEYASAGHNDQIWLKKDGSHEFIKGKGSPLGVLPKGTYTGGKIRPEPGDILVLYTDGAIEEKNQKDEEFGLDRFVEEIKKRKDKPAQIIVEELYDLIMAFSELPEPEQFDDFTVLIFKFNDDYQFKKSFSAVNSSIPKLRDFIEETLKVRKLSQITMDDILLCCDEAATNIIMHAYKDTTIKNPTFSCSIKFINNSVFILLEHQGHEFDRSKVKQPSIEANMKGERKGGFGVFLVEKLMDKVTYSNENGINSVLIEKKLEENENKI